jgi:hypothetical protein
MKLRCHTNQPDYYLYQKDGRWFKTDEALTKLISAHIFAHKAAQLPRMVFYPNWNGKGAEGEKYAAWKVNEFGEQVMRWYWKAGEHTKKCGSRCSTIGEGRCAMKVPAVIEWSAQANCWILAKMPFKATDEESKVLDSK